LQVINSKNQTLAMYKSMVQNLDVVASKLEVLLTLILNDPDFYSPLIYHFFNNHQIFSLFGPISAKLRSWPDLNWHFPHGPRKQNLEEEKCEDGFIKWIGIEELSCKVTSCKFEIID
jgi:hypothetical protein